MFDIIKKNGLIVSISFNQDNLTDLQVTKEEENQLIQYIKGEITELNFEYEINGTEFEKSVWEVIKKIPRGSTRTYLDIAKTIGKESACRAVANACGKNKLAVLIPCHRVIGTHNIGGYKWGVNIKKQLLELEKN